MENKTECINVKDFGAVGDGKTDDTEAIQKAIDFAVEHGGKSIKLGKHHIITETLVIPSNTTINGDIITNG